MNEKFGHSKKEEDGGGKECSSASVLHRSNVFTPTPSFTIVPFLLSTLFSQTILAALVSVAVKSVIRQTISDATIPVDCYC